MNKVKIFRITLYSIFLVLSLVMFTCFSFDFISGFESSTGFESIDFSRDLATTILSISLVITLISIIGLLVTNIISILIECEVIKRGEKTTFVINRLNIIFTTILLCVSFIVLICLKSKVSTLNRNYSLNHSVGVGGILLFVLSIVTFTCALVANFEEKLAFLKQKKDEN